MSHADEVFIRTCRRILDEGTSDAGAAVRPHWPDGEPAHTLRVFGVCSRYDLRKEFPAVTLRKTYLKSAFDEVLWIYQKKSSNIHDLGSHVWDEWADSEGSIGKAYGYQMAKKHPVAGITREGLEKAFPGLAEMPCGARTCFMRKDALSRVLALPPRRADEEAMRRSAAVHDGAGGWRMDQMDKLLYDLANSPFSRRMVTTLWDPEDLPGMALQPCAWSMTYSAEQRPGEDRLTLNGLLCQRSQDMLAAGAWNVAQYALLLMCLAQCAGMLPGELVHMQADCHIYDRHVPLVEGLLKREPRPAPRVSFRDPGKRDFYAFTKDDLVVEGYEAAGPQIQIPVAV